MIRHLIRDGVLFVGAAETRVHLPRAVEQVVAYRDVLVVRLVADGVIPRNVFGVDGRGEIIWQIEIQSGNTLGDTFLGISWESETSVRANYSLGFLWHLDPRTGKLRKSDFTK